MLSTKNYYYYSSIYANTATFDNVSIHGDITNASITTSINTINTNIKTI